MAMKRACYPSFPTKHPSTALPMLVMGQSGHPLQPHLPVPKVPAVLVPSANTDHRTWLNVAFYS